jgi:hypothetical protein
MPETSGGMGSCGAELRAVEIPAAGKEDIRSNLKDFVVTVQYGVVKLVILSMPLMNAYRWLSW